ncbi:MAG: peptidoglycan DD-metalloendopeptidase family protein [Pseudomonadales bacterium]|nr:peptidoglycan DD-metalloendopeptidase family protein [Pseudomonadales bacterium]
MLFSLMLQACATPLKSHYDQRMPLVTRGYHIVKEGDTIFQIAWRYGWDYKELASANGLKKPYVIFPNQRIKLYLAKKAFTGRSASRNSNQNFPTKKKQLKSATGRSTAIVSKNQSKNKWLWPVKGTVLSGFKRNSPLHQGLKIGLPKGSTVVAAAAGSVVYVGAGIRGLEKLIIVEHSNGFLSAYAHNRKIFKKEGETVKAGEKIAETGSNESGKAMLHFEIRRKGVSVDPKKYLP